MRRKLLIIFIILCQTSLGAYPLVKNNTFNFEIDKHYIKHSSSALRISSARTFTASNIALENKWAFDAIKSLSILAISNSSSSFKANCFDIRSPRNAITNDIITDGTLIVRGWIVPSKILPLVLFISLTF